MSRVEKVSALLRKEISEIIRRRIDDRRIGFVSITDVEVSVDFEYAVVFYSQIGTEKEKKETIKGFLSAKNQIQSELCKVMRMRTVPRLSFKYDYSLEKGFDLVNKLNNLNKNDK